MFWEYFSDMSFVLAVVIGGIIAISFVYIRKKRVK